MSADTFTIIVKSPVQSTDLQVELPRSSSVLDLKQQLRQDHPSSPEPVSQRLIYGGRLLRDEEILADAFRQTDIRVPVIVHLVIRAPNAMPSPPPQAQAAPPQAAPQQFPGYAFPAYMQHQFQAQQLPPGFMAQLPPGMYPGQLPQQNPFIALQQQQAMLHQMQQQQQMNNGQGGGNDRLAFLIAAAIVIYIWQQRNAGAGGNVDPDQDPAVQQAQQQQQANPADPNVPAAAQPPRAPSSFSRWILHDWRETPGIIGQICGFFVPFICSLVPSWQPDWPDYQAWVHQRQQQAQQEELRRRMEAELRQPQAAPDPE